MESEGIDLTPEEILQRLTYGVIAGVDDLGGLGECLNLVERLEKSACSASPSWIERVQRLKKIFTDIILDDSKNPDEDWQEVHRLLEALGSDQNDGNGEDPAPFDITTYENSLSEICSSSSKPTDEIEALQMQDPELLKDFIEEAREHLAAIELNIINLEANPEDVDVINEVFRPFHSIKGVAGFLNLTEIHELAHEVENLLDRARSGKLEITDVSIDIILTAVDVLKSQLAILEESMEKGTVIQESSAQMQALVEQIRRFEAGDGRGTERSVLSGETESVGKDGHVEELQSDFDHPLRFRDIKDGHEAVEDHLKGSGERPKPFQEQKLVKESSAVVRVDTQKLDNLVDMVGELVIAQSMVLNNPELENIHSQKFQKDSAQLRRITSELQRISMSMRMVPIRNTFQKMVRLVRDLAKKSGKEVVLEMRGEETEIDRNMVEEIYEPLVHMIRNALDHGIELPAERHRAGKDPVGRIILSAEQKGGSIVIDIQDDGRGLDASRIKEKAIRLGLISPSENLDETRLYELIFHPGFSTKETVTEVSGRGVGMDVVKKCIERLKGKIAIESVPGRGAHFQFKLPLTMAIIDGMVIRIGTERYVVPTVAMTQSLRPSQDAYLTVQGKGEMLKVRNQLMSLIRLYEVFEVEPDFRNPWEGLVLVVEENNRSYCLLADEIIGRQEVVIKNLGGYLKQVVGVSGGAILGDGRVALIVDVKGVINLHDGSRK